jgi:hypothetical protein
MTKWGFLGKSNLLLLLSSEGIDIFYLQGIVAETPKKHTSPPQQTCASWIPYACTKSCGPLAGPARAG